MESILTSIKGLLGIMPDYTHFDGVIVMHINSVIMDLIQMGVSPHKSFIIEDDTSVWGDFLPGENSFEAVKSYMYLRVRLLFDPPESSAAIEAIKRDIDRWEFRLNVAAETKEV